MNCTKCGGEIRRGEDYVSFKRHVERFGAKRFRVGVTVVDAEMLSAYHMGCAPAEG
jgi:hypothetical protein